MDRVLTVIDARTAGGFVTVIVIFSLASFVASALWLSRVLQLRRKVQPNRCGSCGFRFSDPPTGSRPCPGCGAAFITAKKNRAALPLASMAAVVSGVLLGFACYGVTRNVLWESHTPIWLLRHDSRSYFGVARESAATELFFRMNRGAMEKDQVAAVTDDILAMQEDPRLPWLRNCGFFIETARAKGMVSDAQWQRYLQHVGSVSFDVPSTVTRGATLPVRIRIEPARCGSDRLLTQSMLLLVEIPDLLTAEMPTDVVRGTIEPGKTSVVKLDPPTENPVPGCEETLYFHPSPLKGQVIGWNIHENALAALGSGTHDIILHVTSDVSDRDSVAHERFAIRAHWQMSDR